MDTTPPVAPGFQRVAVPAYEVRFDLVPRELAERVFGAAAGVAWEAQNFGFVAKNPEAFQMLEALKEAVSAADRHTVPVQIEHDEPMCNFEEP